MQKTPQYAEHVVLRNTKLKAIRLELGLTQQWVADSLGIDSSTLGRWEENEEKITLGRLRQLAVLYHVSVEWLISPDPIVLNMHDNKVENGANGAHNTVNVMPKEMLEQVTAQYNAHIELLHKMAERMFDQTERMLDLTERMFTLIKESGPVARQ